MTLLTSFFILLAGLALMITGAEAIVRGGSSLATRLGLPPLFVGLTIIAFGTSSPELVVSVSAALQGRGDISVGNVIGSNIFNIAVILGITAMITPIRVHLSVIKVDIPVMIGVSALAFVLVLRSEVSRLHGVLLALALLLYFITTFLLIRKEEQQSSPPVEIAVPGKALPWWKDPLFLVGGIFMLAYGSTLMVDSAVAIAESFGISQAVIGLTIIAAGTSMPELVTSVVAAFRRQPDMAIGNVVGSNILNILGILGISAIITPLSSPGVTIIDLSAMMVLAVVLLPLALTGKTLNRWEGGMLFLVYCFYLFWLWPDN